MHKIIVGTPAKSQIRDFLLILSKQFSKYSGFNYTDTIGSIIFKFGLTNQISCFMMDNTYNNNTAINNFIIKLRFNSKERCV